MGRVLFRTLLAVYARKDLGQYRGPATQGGLGRMLAGWRFVRGKGRVPQSQHPAAAHDALPRWSSAAGLPADMR